MMHVDALSTSRICKKCTVVTGLITKIINNFVKIAQSKYVYIYNEEK